MNWKLICAIYLHCVGSFVATNEQQVILYTTAETASAPLRNQRNSDETDNANHSNGQRELFFGALLPSVKHGVREAVAETVLPAIDLAIKKVQRPGGLLEGFNITVEYRDTHCSSTYGPLAAFELYNKRKPGGVRPSLFGIWETV